MLSSGPFATPYSPAAMQPHRTAPPAPPLGVILRDVEPADVPTLFAFESDPVYCAMAMIKPRTRAAFEAVWEKIFSERAAGVSAMGVAQKVILAEGPEGWQVCGSIGCFAVDGGHAVGYGLARSHWGRGIASRALALLLAEVRVRPLHARVAASNAASIRVLTKNGFVIESRKASPETERYMACEELSLVLA
jgi:RimJ/RimL family protein N-acetyltransferase